MSRLAGEVWKEYLDLRTQARTTTYKAIDSIDADEPERAQAWALLAVAGRLECLCYLMTHRDDS